MSALTQRTRPQMQGERKITPSIDWNANEEFLYDAQGNVIEGFKHIVRDDTRATLSVTQKSYNTMSTKEFSGVVERLAEVTGLVLDGYDGNFKGGKKIFAYLKNNASESPILAGSRMDYFMVVGNGYDYISPFFTGVISKYVRCENQFGSISSMQKVRHTASKDFRIGELIAYYEDYARKQESMNEKFQQFVDTPVTKDDREEFLNYVMDVPTIEGEYAPSTRKKVLLEELGVAVVKESHQLGSTLWGLFNGATWWTTHQHPTKEAHFGNLFGSNAEYNERAFKFCADRLRPTV